MYSQMVLFVATLTLFFSPIITLEAFTLFEIPTTIKGDVVENTLPFYLSTKLDQDYKELRDEGIKYFAHKYWLKKRNPIKFHLDSATKNISKKGLTKIPRNEMRKESMRQFIKVCTQSFTNVKLDYLIACALEGFKPL